MAFNFIPTEIDKLLEDENVELETLLEEADIVQECRAGNIYLINFIKTEDNLIKLKNITLEEPPEINLHKDFKMGSIASDLLSSPVRAFAESVTAVLLPDLYDHLHGESVHPLTMSFILKILYNSLVFCPDEFMSLVYSRGNFVSFLLKNIHVFAVSGFIVDIYSGTCRLLEYFDATSLALRLVLCLAAEDEKSSVASLLLCDLITGPVDIWSTEFGQSQLLRHSVISRLCGMLPLPTCKNVLQVLCSIFDPVFLDDEFADQSNKYEPVALLDQIVPHVAKFSTLLRQGDPTVPLGSARLSAVRVIASSLKYEHVGFISAVLDENTVTDILDLFFHYPYNSLLHCQVYRMVQNVICLMLSFDPAEKLGRQIFVEYELVDKLMTIVTQEIDHGNAQFLYGNRKRDSCAQAMSILMTLNDFCVDRQECKHPLLTELMTPGGPLGDTWVAFCENNMEKYSRDNKCNIGNAMVACSDDGEDEEIDMEDLADLDIAGYAEFVKIVSEPPSVLVVPVPLTHVENLMAELTVTDPFEEIDRAVKSLDPSSFDLQASKNQFHDKFEEVRDKVPLVFGQPLPALSEDQVAEVQMVKLEGVRWEEDEYEAEMGAEPGTVFEWPTLTDVWGCFDAEAGDDMCPSTPFGQFAEDKGDSSSEEFPTIGSISGSAITPLSRHPTTFSLDKDAVVE